jgi:chromosomal replication initiation ATPase DnaA
VQVVFKKSKKAEMNKANFNININYSFSQQKDIISFVDLLKSQYNNIKISFFNPEVDGDLEIKYIKRTIEKFYNLKRYSIDLPTRKAVIVKARQISMYFAKEKTKLSLHKIGNLIGGKDHSTVISAIKTVDNLIFSEPRYRKEITELRDKLS